MSIPCKFELSILKHDEQELILKTHHPMVGEMEGSDLASIRGRLRNMRDRERTMAQHRKRETKGTADQRGKSFTGTAEHAKQRQSVFTSAIRRVSSELARIRKFEAREELGERARRALALRRARQFDRPESEQTSREGMRPIPSRRRKTKVHPGKIGSVSQANKSTQARRDSKRSRGGK